MAEVKEALDARIRRHSRQILGAAHIHRQQVGIPSLRLGTGQVKDHVHAFEGGADGALVRQADDGYFHRQAPGETR